MKTPAERKPMYGSPPYQVTRFTGDGIPSYCDWSAECGLICSRGRSLATLFDQRFSIMTR